MEENEVSKSNKIKIIVITALVFLLSIAGVTYAYFTIQIVGNDTASSMRLRTANMSLVYNDVQIVSGEYAQPGWTQTKTLTVTNNGNVDADYIIKFRELVNTIINGELVLSATCSASTGTCDNLPQRAVHSTSTEITDAYMYGPITIAPGVTHTYTLTVLFKETGSNQNYNQNKYFNGTLNIGDGTATDESCFTTEEIDSTTVRISGYTCDNTDIIIPSTINNKTVTEIKDGTSYGYHATGVFGNSGLTSVVLPNTLTKIGVCAFGYDQYASGSATQLTSVVIPNSVTTIGSSAFSNNQLTSVVIPNSVTTISGGAFSNNQLTSVVIPDSVTTIGYNAFKQNQLTSVVIPNGVTTIDQFAFYNNQLTSVVIPSSITELRCYTFDSNQLISVVIPSSVTSVCGFANNQLTSVVIPNSVTTISSSAFQSNQLTSVVIPNNVTTIGQSAFQSNQLTSVVIPNSVTEIGNSAFLGNQLTSVTIEGKSSSSDFTTYLPYWGWASAENRTCTVTNNTSNVSGGCVYWAGN